MRATQRSIDLMQRRIWLIVLSLLSFGAVAICQVPLHVPSSGLVGYWPIYGDAKDYSGNEFNARVIGATLTDDRFGEASQAYQLDGKDDYLTLNNYSALQPDSAFTISAWVYIDSSCDNNARIISYENDIPPNYSSYQMFIGNKNEDSLGRFSLGIRILDGIQPPSNGEYHRNTFEGSNIIGEWQHLVGSWNGKVMTCYQNGVLISESPKSGSLFYDLGKLNIGSGKIGSLAPGREIFFKGMIDEIAIWDRALTSNEVRQLYNGPPCTTRLAVTDTPFIEVGLTSLHPIVFMNVLKVYPNPARDFLVIDVGDLTKMEGYRILVISSDGRVVEDLTINDQLYELPLTDWGAKGLYFMQLFDAKGNLIDVKKIVLQ